MKPLAASKTNRSVTKAKWVLPGLMQCLPGCFPRRATREDFLSHQAQTCLLPWYRWHPPRVGAGFGWPAAGLSVHPGSCSRDTSKCYRCIIKFSNSTLLAKPRINSSCMYFCIKNTPCISSQLSSLPFFSLSLLPSDWFPQLEKQVSVLSSDTFNSFSAAMIWTEFLLSQPAATEANSFVQRGNTSNNSQVPTVKKLKSEQQL